MPIDSRMLRSLLRDRAGATSIEYAVIAGFLSIVIATVVDELGVEVTKFFQLVKDAF